MGDSWRQLAEAYRQLSCGHCTVTTGKDKCIDGIVTVARSGAKLGWNWFATADGKNTVAYALLSPE